MRVVVIDIRNRKSKEYDWVSEIIFNSNGTKYGFKARKGSKYLAVINGKESKKYDEVKYLVFSSDGLRYGFLARKGNKEVVVIDGKESKEYDEVKDLTFNSDGSKYGFVAKKGSKWIVVVNGNEIGNEYTSIDDFRFTDGKIQYRCHTGISEWDFVKQRV